MSVIPVRVDCNEARTRIVVPFEYGYYLLELFPVPGSEEKFFVLVGHKPDYIEALEWLRGGTIAMVGTPRRIE